MSAEMYPMPEMCPIDETDTPKVLTSKSDRLHLSKNRKMTSRVKEYTPGSHTRTKKRKPGKTYYDPREFNSFGLPSEESCPGCTEVCKVVCYAADSEYADTELALERNYELLKKHQTVEEMTALISEMMTRYVKNADNLEIPQDERRFRVHWSGDFFSVDYAKAWRNAILENPDIKFMIFTHSFQPDVNVLPVLSGLKNAELFLSVDYANVDVAVEAIKDAPDARVSYLVEYAEDAKELIEKMGRTACRAFACPERINKPVAGRRPMPILPLISKKGGACSVCKYCTKKEDDKTGVIRDVVFTTTGRKKNPSGTRLPMEEVERAKRKPKPSKPKEVFEETTIPLFPHSSVEESEIPLFRRTLYY